MQKLFLFIVLLNSYPSLKLNELSQPLIINGRYYYDQADTKNNHFQHALITMGKKIFSPFEWYKCMVTLFVKADTDRVQKLLNPQQIKPQQQSIEPQFIWIGHSTFLIQINGFNILTDPIFGNVKIQGTTLTKRAMLPGINLDDLPPIDVILISHNHPDHADYNSLSRLSKKGNITLLVPQGDKQLFETMGFSSVIEHTWGNSTYLEKDGYTITFTFLPARHWSLHFFSWNNYRKSLWGSWMLQTTDHTLYFAGDSAYGNHFKEIAVLFPSIDIAFLPIAPTSAGKNKHKNCHINAQEALTAFLDLDAHCFVPMHYGTFFLDKETLENPLQQLNNAWDMYKELLIHKNLLWAQCGKEYKTKLFTLR